MIVMIIGRWSLAHADADVRMVGIGGSLPFHPDIIIRSIVDPAMLPSLAGKGSVNPVWRET